MSKTLIIVESPAKAKTLGKFLGKKYIVKSSMGHIRDLPKSQIGVDVGNDFEPKYITIRGKGNILKELRDSAKKSNKILLAVDPDREGEAIAWHLQNILNIEKGKDCRIEFNEITEDAVKNAIKNPRAIDMDLVNAQQARRILDRLVGYKLSPLLWKKIRKGLSAGRVQTIAVKIICDREDEINSFVSEEYWSIEANFIKENENNKFKAVLNKTEGRKPKISSKKEVEAILKDLQGKEAFISKVLKKKRLRKPPAPFTTSSLQQEAFRKLNFTAKKTMRIAQQLYEGIELGKTKNITGLITYMRTDSTHIADSARQLSKEYIIDSFGKDYYPSKPNSYPTKKQSQNAHEAIRPTSVKNLPGEIKSFLSRDQLRLYKLIWERFLASQMSSAVFNTTTIDIEIDKYQFKAVGSVISFPGFMKVYIEGKDNDEQEDNMGVIPDVAAGDKLNVEKITPKQHFTQPPGRFSEASLVKTLEDLGIGRPSTYAPIIDTILARGYVERFEKRLKPTDLGYLVKELLEEYFSFIMDLKFTAKLEKDLDEIGLGNTEWKDIIRDFYSHFEELLQKAEKEIGKIEIEDEVSDEVCEKCGRNMVIKMGRYGKFLACPGFPDCRNTKPLMENIGVKCPLCKTGDVIQRKSKKGRVFYGCSSYPECDFVSWDKPTGEVCEKCPGYYVEKNTKKEIKTVCNNRDCENSNRNPDNEAIIKNEE